MNPVSALFSVGWGSDDRAEAFLIIAQRPGGTVYWEGILFALSSFVDIGAIQPVIEPGVTISPLSGPLETMVQVVASGFPPNAPVTVWIGPENSEFGEVTRGTTDANGIFITQVPAQGALGMNLVFGVSAEGQPGVSSPDLFHITDVPESSVTLSPLSGPSGTMVQIVASGFPSNVPVTVWVGPENSEFREAARGTTDANGVFTTQIPAQGGPGMNLVFGVSAEGQSGVSSSDMFQITQADSSITLSPPSGPSGTMVQVVGSGFPPNAPVTIWMGLEKFSFQEAARGTTDASGLFSVQVPVQGTPGTNFTFAVSVDGQTGLAGSTIFKSPMHMARNHPRQMFRYWKQTSSTSWRSRTLSWCTVAPATPILKSAGYLAA